MSNNHTQMTMPLFAKVTGLDEMIFTRIGERVIDVGFWFIDVVFWFIDLHAAWRKTAGLAQFLTSNVWWRAGFRLTLLFHFTLKWDWTVRPFLEVLAAWTRAGRPQGKSPRRR